MKKKQLVSLSLAAGLAVTTLATGGAVTAKPAPQEDAQQTETAGLKLRPNNFFSGIPLEAETVERLQANGKEAKEARPQGLEAIDKKIQKFQKQGDPIATQPFDADQNVLAVMVKFPTVDGKSPVPGSPNTRVPANYFKDLLFGTEYNPYTLKEGDLDFTKFATYQGITAPTDRTLRNYYSQASYGKLQVRTQNDPVWVTAPHPYEYYFGNTGSLPATEDDYNANGYGNFPNNVQGLVIDALKQVDAQVDFTKYAVNGKVPGIFIIHEGTGAEFSRDPRLIWSHKWQLKEKYAPEHPNADADGVLTESVYFDGVEVDTYSMEPEIGGDTTGWSGAPYGPIPPYVGVYAHEYGHVLGLPDLYDYGYNSAGVGAWSVMAGGSWTRYPNHFNYSGNTPVLLDAWSRYFAGLADVKQAGNNDTLNFSLNSVAKGGEVIKVDVPRSGGSEYFLIENRQQDGYDKGLFRYGTAAHGLVVWHVDDNVMAQSFRRPNEAENFNPVRNGERKGNGPASNGQTHYGVGVVQADGKFELERNVANNYGGDAFPGTTGKTKFELSNDFYSGSYYKFPGSTGTGFFGIYNIFEKDGVVTGTLKTKNNGVVTQ